MTAEHQICATLLDMMESTPYTEIKASDLAKRAGVSRSSFYFYFDSVYAVLDRLENDFIHGISDDYTTIYKLSMNRSGRIGTKETIRPTIAFVGRNLRQFRLLSGPNGSPTFQEKLLKRAESVGVVLYCDGKLSRQEIMLRFNTMAGAQWYIYRWWSNHEQEVSQEEIIDYVAKLVDGLTFA